MPQHVENFAVSLDAQGLDFGVRYGYAGTSSTAPALMRASLWSDPGAGGERSIKSSSVHDGAGNGSGLLKVRITYYNHDGSGPFKEEVTLNGTGAVAFGSANGSNVRFIEQIEGIEVGNNSVAVGNVDVFENNNGTGNVMARINTGENRTFYGHHFVPAGKKCFILSVSVGIKGLLTGGRLLTRFKNVLASNPVELDVGDTPRAPGNGMTAERAYAAPVVVAGPGLVTLWAHPDAGTAATWYAALSFFDR